MTELKRTPSQPASSWGASHSTKYNREFYQPVFYSYDSHFGTLWKNEFIMGSECDVDRELDKLTGNDAIDELLPNFRKLAREFSSNEDRPRIIRSLLRLPESERGVFATQVQNFFDNFPIYPTLQSTCIESLANIQCPKYRTRLLKLAFNFNGHALDSTERGWIIIAGCNMTDTELTELNTQVNNKKSVEEDHEPIIKDVIKQTMIACGILKEEAKGQPVLSKSSMFSQKPANTSGKFSSNPGDVSGKLSTDPLLSQEVADESGKFAL